MARFQALASIVLTQKLRYAARHEAPDIAPVLARNMRRTWFSVLSAFILAAAAYAGCSLEGRPGGPGSGASGATGGSPPVTASTGGSGGIGNASSSSMAAGGFNCSLDPQCPNLDATNCHCVGCINDGVCEDMGAGLLDDCVCIDCQDGTNTGASYCDSNQGCDLNGQCDPFNEGCACADCFGHPLCTGVPPTSTSGAGGGGGGPTWCEIDSGCANPDLTQCLCVGCTNDGICYDGTNTDDCVCPDCNDTGATGAAYCTDNLGCNSDNLCDPYVEGCACADCNGVHPNCMGTGGAGGAGGGP